MTENLTTNEVPGSIEQYARALEYERGETQRAVDRIIDLKRELDRLTARLSEYMEELNSARLTCEYWKAEQIAANEVVCRLTAEVAELRRDLLNMRMDRNAYKVDAERYRYLRSRSFDLGHEDTCPYIHAAENDRSFWALNGMDADTTIDAARLGEQP